MCINSFLSVVKDQPFAKLEGRKERIEGG